MPPQRNRLYPTELYAMSMKTYAEVLALVLLPLSASAFESPETSIFPPLPAEFSDPSTSNTLTRYHLLVTTFADESLAKKTAEELSSFGPTRIEQRPKGWAVLLGNFATEEIAIARFIHLGRREGILLDAVEATQNTSVKVLLGRFPLLKDAARLNTELRDAGYIPGDLISRGSNYSISWHWDQEQDARMHREQLMKAGYFAHVEVSDGDSLRETIRPILIDEQDELRIGQLAPFDSASLR